MPNHIYTSVKNANLVDCDRKQHITSQPTVLTKENFLGEFRTDLDKKKVLVNLGIVSDVLLEWEFIKGDIGKNTALMNELDIRTKYISNIDGVQKSLSDGIIYLESIIGGEDDRLNEVETLVSELNSDFTELKEYLQQEIEIDKLKETLDDISEKVNNITTFIKVSEKENNAIQLLSNETPGLYVKDFSNDVSTLRTDVNSILSSYITKDELGGGSFDFVEQSEFDNYRSQTNSDINGIKSDLINTVKTDSDGSVKSLNVETLSSNTDTIKVSDSFEVTSNVPLDVRCVVQTLDELYALDPKVCYSGMGVIVNSLSSLYILRKPSDTQSIDKEYISNQYNWKCPEDLVTTALTKEEYDNLEEINPNVFYYIYEEEITRTEAPKREDFSTEEEFQTAWNEWETSLKTLSQEYMSAAWGVDIESKLGQKASSDTVSALAKQISDIKGGSDGPSLGSLEQNIATLQQTTGEIKEVIDEILQEDTGRLVEAENKIKEIESGLDNYVSKDYIQNDENEFIFVKNSDYAEDQEKLKSDLSESVSTGILHTNEIKLQNKSVTVSENRLIFDSNVIATKTEIPNLIVMTQNDYNSLENKDESAFYLTYEPTETLVTRDDLQTELNKLNQTLTTLAQQISSLSERVTQLETFHQSSE